MRSLTYYFHMKTKILVDFQICISVRLTTFANKNLFLLRHLEISSVVLFNKVSGSAQMMEIRSDKQRSQTFGTTLVW